MISSLFGYTVGGTAQMNLTLYSSQGSGNSYKVELLLRLLRQPYQTRPVDLRRNEQLGIEFLARNRFGQVPVLVDGDIVLTDSHAIMLYLAGQYGDPVQHDWAPLDPLSLALVMRWLSVSANEIQNGFSASSRPFLRGIARVPIMVKP